MLPLESSSHVFLDHYNAMSSPPHVHTCHWVMSDSSKFTITLTLVIDYYLIDHNLTNHSSLTYLLQLHQSPIHSRLLHQSH